MCGLLFRLCFGYRSYTLCIVLSCWFSPGEWFLDVSTETNSPAWTLFFWPLSKAGERAVPPTTVAVKVRDLCFNVTNTKDFRVTGVDFFGCTFQCRTCRNAVVANVTMLYPTFNRLIPEMGPVDVDLDKEQFSLPADKYIERFRLMASMDVNSQVQKAVATLIEVRSERCKLAIAVRQPSALPPSTTTIDLSGLGQ